MSDTIFGKILTGNECRDAYHQAIIPMFIASEKTKPSDWVRIKSGDKTQVITCDKSHKNCIGFVDPFIVGSTIPVGAKVYIFLKQGLVGDMRHHWTSPFFNDEDITTTKMPKRDKVILSEKQLEAEQWLINICKEYNLDFDTIRDLTEENAESKLYVMSETMVEIYVANGADEDDTDILLDTFSKNILFYKGISINRDDLYYIDWSCRGC